MARAKATTASGSTFTDLVRKLGTSKAYVQRVISPLRAAHRQQQRTTPAAPAADAAAGGAGVAGPGRLQGQRSGAVLPERGEMANGKAAKQVYAGCQVQQQRRELAVRAARGREEDHGIFAGTTPHQHTRLRGNPAPDPTVW
jgi:hypothetical protein